MRKTKWSDHKLSYRQPAANWNEALPVGNGRLGGMVFGGVETERVQFNEDTLWSGGPGEWNNPHAREVLPLVRQARLSGVSKTLQGLDLTPWDSTVWNIKDWRRTSP